MITLKELRSIARDSKIYVSDESGRKMIEVGNILWGTTAFSCMPIMKITALHGVFLAHVDAPAEVIEAWGNYAEHSMEED